MTPTTAPTHPHTSDGPRRLVRTPDKKIAGVCSGIAHYLGIDPTIVRVLFLLSVFAGGIGLLAYVVGWIVMPKGDPPSGRSVDAGDAWTVVAVVAVALGAAAVFGWPGFAVGGEALFGVLLLAGGAALLLRRPAAAGPAAEPLSRDVEQPSSSSVEVEATAAFDTDEEAAAKPVDTSPVPETGRRGIVTAGTLSLLAVGTAGLVSAALADWVDLSTATVLAAALVIVGGGLVLASVVGPAPWLFVVASLLTGALLVAATVDPWVEDGVGEKTFAPLTAGDLKDTYELGLGDLRVDLAALEPWVGTREVTVTLGVGSAIVTVPPDVDLELHGHVDVGDLVGPDGASVDGFDKRIDEAYDGIGAGKLVVDLDVGIGRGEVRRGS